MNSGDGQIIVKLVETSVQTEKLISFVEKDDFAHSRLTWSSCVNF